MAELHSALKALAPEEWSNVPASSEGELDTYLADLFLQCQTVLDSIPIPPPDEVNVSSRSSTHSSATKATEVSPSAERSAPPPSEHEKLQKEWGKPLKMKPSENPLGMHVYKLSGKDGKGAWFARRSVHEGIGFSKFKKSLEMEFPESMSEPGPPGTGNIRGIGGEEKVEDIKVHNRGRVEVYRLSAQFPGPTTPRDFVTLLITSTKAMNEESQRSDGGLLPRHYMILSKPCNHPKTQPQTGFIRGYYESVEFIREVPRKLKASQSSVELNKLGHNKGEHNLQKDMLKHNVEKKSHTFHPSQDIASHDRPHTAHEESHSSRKRAVTVGSPDAGHIVESESDVYDPEENPVEWIMITRSDPGGSVPKFMVERGTPGSICADAVKFLDWACQKDFSDNETHDVAAGVVRKPSQGRRESFQSWRARSTVGVEEFTKTQEPPSESAVSQPGNQGIWDTVSGAAATLRPYTPQAVLNHLPYTGAQPESSQSPLGKANLRSSSELQASRDEDESKSIISTTSFASAEDHLSSSEDVASLDSIGSPARKSDRNKEKEKDPASNHEKEIIRLAERREALQRKFASLNAKIEEAKAKHISKEENALQKAAEKHDKELKKQEARYKKELEKIEQKQQRERKKMAEKKRKQEDKDEKHRLTRERDEAREELDLVKKEAESLRNLVQELQKENTSLVMRLGKLGVVADSITKETDKSPSQSILGGSGQVRSRGSSFSRVTSAGQGATETGSNKKAGDKTGQTTSTGASMKSNQS